MTVKSHNHPVHLYVPLPSGGGLPGEGEGVAGVPRVQDHVVAGVLAADHGGSGSITLSSEPGLQIKVYSVLELLALSRHRSSFSLHSNYETFFWLVPLIAKC